MPRQEVYEGLSRAEFVRSFAEHHYEEATRHISLFEYEELLRVADILESTTPPGHSEE